MLSEFGISPAFFRSDAYESNSVADVCLGSIFRPLLEECVVRNLRNGEWAQFATRQTPLHLKAKELLKKLAVRNRLVSYSPTGATLPTDDLEWEQEALASHQAEPLTGLIFHREAKEQRYPTNPDVSCPERLPGTPFWRDRPCSYRIPRTLAEYRPIIDPFIRWANYIAFIDPHLDPDAWKYRDFLQLLINPILLRRTIGPKIEIHRVAWRGDGTDRRPLVHELENSFNSRWSQTLRSNGLSIEVYLWDNFHDRFLATNLMGMSWSNGFDMTSDAAARATISRLSRTDLDGLQNEFGSNSAIHGLIHRFTVG
ncbi:MAG: hypothetical protein PHC88_01200 [Terrimicrobiaceae bacterium]|nr:hypothetical protein [Terrimicrobiaceae bacterium]